MQVGIYTGRNKLSHIKDFKLKCSLLCHFVINRFVKSGRTYKAIDIDLHLKRMAENEHGATFPVGIDELPPSKVNKKMLHFFFTYNDFYALLVPFLLHFGLRDVFSHQGFPQSKSFNQNQPDSH